MTFVPCPMLFHSTEFAMLRPTLLALVALIGGAAGIAINGAAAALSSGTQLRIVRRRSPLRGSPSCDVRRVTACRPSLWLSAKMSVAMPISRRAPAWPR